MEQNGAPAAGQQSEREAFEAWCARQCYRIRLWPDSGRYHPDSMQSLWEGWQARATLPACAEQGEAVAWLHEFTDPHTGERRSEARKNKPRDYEMLPGETVTPLYASLPPPARNGEMSDERIDALLSDLDSIGRDFDMYEYGLPMHGADEEDGPINKLREAVRKWSASCAPKQTEGDGK